MPPLTDDEMIRINYEHYAGLFPRTCASCGRTFASLREYIQLTQRIGATISYDAELGEWKTTKPLGAAALSNCPCGSTLALTTEGLPLETIQAMLEWIRVETAKRRQTPEQLLDYIRNEVRKRALAD